MKRTILVCLLAILLFAGCQPDTSDCHQQMLETGYCDVDHW